MIKTLFLCIIRSLLYLKSLAKLSELIKENLPQSFPLCISWYCRGYCEMSRKYKIKFGGSTCSSQIISLTKQKQNLNNFKIKVYYSAGILYQRTHNVVVVIVFAFGVRRNGNVFARLRGASQVLVGKWTVQ